MRKVATPQDLQTELLRIVAYTQGSSSPSRVEIARNLNDLADRVAGSILPKVKWNDSLTGDKVRIRWANHPDNSILIEELPSKPLKRRLRRAFVDTRWWVQPREGGSYFIVQNLLRDAKFNPGMTYDSAVRALQKALDKAKSDAIKNYPDTYSEDWFKRTGWDRIIDEEQVNYLNVEPADYTPIKIEGKDFSGKSQWDEFKFYADRDDDEDMAYQEGMNAFYKSKSPGGARKLFKLLKSDPSIVKNMNVDQFTAWLAKNKIAYDFVPTVWR